MKVLAICGSIRENSSNHILLNAARLYFSKLESWTYFEIKQLPYFDPALQFSLNIPEQVKIFRKAANDADLILISTPEYAHGIPGVLKNALEWLICEETIQKKALVLIGSPSGGEFVRSHLLETLKTRDLSITPNSILTVTNARKLSIISGIINDSELDQNLKQFMKNNSF